MFDELCAAYHHKAAFNSNELAPDETRSQSPPACTLSDGTPLRYTPSKG